MSKVKCNLMHIKELRRQLIHILYGPILVLLYHYGFLTLEIIFGMIVGGAVTVGVNSLSVVYKSDSSTIAAMPDVCLTPDELGSEPITYPDNASDSLSIGTKSVKSEPTKTVEPEHTKTFKIPQ